MQKSSIEIAPYRVEYGLETVKMIRESFQRTMSLEQHNRFDDLNNHLNFFTKYEPKYVRVAIDLQSSDIVSCMVLKDNEIEQLYVHVDYQWNGIGTRLINIAKQESPNSLELYAFQLNTHAQAFYKKQGFVESARGMASNKGNPWAVTPEQLADIKYVWSAALPQGE